MLQVLLYVHHATLVLTVSPSQEHAPIAQQDHIQAYQAPRSATAVRQAHSRQEQELLMHPHAHCAMLALSVSPSPLRVPIARRDHMQTYQAPRSVIAAQLEHFLLKLAHLMLSHACDVTPEPTAAAPARQCA